ncbi:hypothetical protein QOZ80_2AG0108820 [Eleusine coracana subsp. coracana]|nr:hypothetical protein QOZ80_2AG0108820 [Eleusine coracana subsp. coracana]
MMQQQGSNGGVAASPATSTAGGGPAVELPLHLTEKILCSINPLQSARHAVVCKSWAATVSTRLARPVPHLFLCTPPSIDSPRRGLVVSVPLDGAPTTVVPSRVRSSDTNGLRCIGATPGGGHVAFAAGWWSRDVVLVNPVTGALQRVNVGEPCLDPRFSRVLAPGSGGDAFFAVEGYKLVLWRQRGGNKEAWSRCAVTGTLNPTNNIVSAVNCKGCFYLLLQDGCLSKVDATAPAQAPLHIEKLPVPSLADQFGSGRLLEADGDVLFVRQLLAYKEEIAIESCMSSLSVGGFEVYRLDVEEQRWTKVDKLADDTALFVSPGSSFAVRASEVEGCRSNFIYFAGENQYYSSPACREDGVSSWGMYSVEDGRVLFEHVVVTEPGRAAEVLWFLPRVTLGSLCKSLHKFV